MKRKPRNRAYPENASSCGIVAPTMYLQYYFGELSKVILTRMENRSVKAPPPPNLFSREENQVQ